jgi:hypothetical protein
MSFRWLPKRLGGFVRRRRKTLPASFMQFGQGVGEVMATRVMRAMTGELDAVEARRMVAEKQLAAVRAQVAFTQAIMSGKATTAPNAYFDVYRRAVAGNRKRLKRRGRLWWRK